MSSMSDLALSFHVALELIIGLDTDLVEIVLLSLRITLTALLIAVIVGLPLGAVIGVFRFPGRAAVTVLFNALMGLPPVVVGLLVYLLLSRAGPLGQYGAYIALGWTLQLADRRTGRFRTGQCRGGGSDHCGR